MELFTIVIVILYLLMTAYLGYRGYKETKTAADYLLAGRQAHPIVMSLSYGATFISTSAIVGFGGVAANLGMGVLWLTVLNISVGIFIAFVFLGGPTRRMGHHLDAHTFPEFIGRRYDSKFLHVFTALLIFLFMPLYAMAVIKGGSEFIATVFHVRADIALYLFALIVAAYVIPGGMKGVMLTDALQAIIMIIGMGILLVGTYAGLGGFSSAHQALTDMGSMVPPALQAQGHQGWTSMPKFGWSEALMPAVGTPRPPDQFDLWWVMVTTIVMGVGIGVLAQPQLIVRFMTVKSQQALNRGVPVGGIFILLMTGVAFAVGGLSNAYFAKNEIIRGHVISDTALMDPGPDGKAKLMPIAPDAAPEVKARGKRFVSYRLENESEDADPRYLLFTPAMKIERGADGVDTIRPGLISIARTINNQTTIKGNVDQIIPIFVDSALPKWFSVVFMLCLLSAAMSTLSSQFHTIGTAIGRDVVGTFLGVHSGKAVVVTRLGVGVGLIIAIVLGHFAKASVIAIATAVFFGMCAATFLPSFVGGLYWKRPSRTAAVASVLTGAVLSIFWLVCINGKTAESAGVCKLIFGQDTLLPAGYSVTWAVVDPLIIALPISALVYIAVTLLTRPMAKEYADYIFGGPKPAEK